MSSDVIFEVYFWILSWKDLRMLKELGLVRSFLAFGDWRLLGLLIEGMRGWVGG